MGKDRVDLFQPLRARGAALRERAVVVVVPCSNSDGAARTELQRGRRTLKELRCNAHGVDLNRNFPLPQGASPSFLDGLWLGKSRCGDLARTCGVFGTRDPRP